jgi:hypothetical protein
MISGLLSRAASAFIGVYKMKQILKDFINAVKELASSTFAILKQYCTAMVKGIFAAINTACNAVLDLIVAWIRRW